jgi:hypothetical protein
MILEKEVVGLMLERNVFKKNDIKKRLKVRTLHYITVQPFPWRIFSFVQKKFLFRTPQSRNSIT